MLYRFGVIMALLALLVGCGGNSDGPTSTPKSQTTGGAETNVVSSISSMGLGDIYYVDFTDGAAGIDFSGTDTTSQYTLIVQSTEQSSSSVQITSNELSADVSSFDSVLREREKGLAGTAEPIETSASLSKAIGTLGDSHTFRVLSSITSTSSYDEITATSRCIEDHVNVYVDDDISREVLTSDDIATLCDGFEHAAAIEEDVYGAASDINGDGRVVALITLAVNRLGASGGGIITGYFYASDLYSRTSSNRTSNEMEIIYMLAPDPNGEQGTAISKDFAMSNLIPAVMPHELQHAISYNRHVFINGGGSEENWLNEALSHFSEDLTGFNVENPSRVQMALDYMDSTSLVAMGSPDLYERGAEYLFLRYLYERAADPDGFLGAMENTTNTGTENVVAAFGDSDANFDEWGEFMRRWAIAIALTNTGLTSTAQYQFADRTINSVTGNWDGVCLICNAEDGRGTVLTGPYMEEITAGTVNLTLAGTATAYYTISSSLSSINLNGDADAGLQGVLIRTE